MKKGICQATPLYAKRRRRSLSYTMQCNCVVISSCCKEFGMDGVSKAILKYCFKRQKQLFLLKREKPYSKYYLLSMLLKEMLHEWDTNIIEGVNKFSTKFLEKDRNLNDDD
jgi:hypothetical protein